MQANYMKIAILQTCFVEDNQLTQLANQLNLNIITEQEKSTVDFILFYNDTSFLCLQKVSENILSPIFVDFTNMQTDYRRFHSNKKNEMIAKAIGLNKTSQPSIIDTTAGLGQDAFMLATLGCSITLIEQSSIITALLQDGLERAKQKPSLSTLINRMHLIHANSIDYLQTLPEIDKPDIVYLDPMFPVRKKTALAKKEMQTLQVLLQNNPLDEKILFKAALACAQKRIVVKRHKSSPTITSRKPDIVFTGKSCRFDVYTNFTINNFVQAPCHYSERSGESHTK